MSDLILRKQNESFIKFECEKSIAQELADYFTFFVPGYQFMPAYKNRLWDGKIRLADLRTYTIYHGLVPYIEKFCEERKYKLEIDAAVNNAESFSALEANEFLEQLYLDKSIITEGVREYQYKAFITAVRNRRMLLLSPTGSGKSLIQYLILRYLQYKGYKKGLLIVPTTSLVEQMYSDFESYGYDAANYAHRQYSGKDKHTDKFLTITTWQSIYNLQRSFYENFDVVIGDEAHQFKSKSLVGIMTKMDNAKYRFGFTGTLDGSQTHKWVLEGLFGPSYKVTQTKELIEKGHLSKLQIKILLLKHNSQQFNEYEEEVQYIIGHEKRNNFIKNLVLDLKGNSLVLFNRVESHGQILYELINNSASKKRKVFFVHGGVDTETREKIREITEKENDAIIVASYGTFSTGINIKNLHNVIFASPSKSRVRNLQSIGRVLRKGENKNKAILYDIADDATYKSRKNYTLNHLDRKSTRLNSSHLMRSSMPSYY